MHRLASPNPSLSRENPPGHCACCARRTDRRNTTGILRARHPRVHRPMSRRRGIVSPPERRIMFTSPPRPVRSSAWLVGTPRSQRRRPTASRVPGRGAALEPLAPAPRKNQPNHCFVAFSKRTPAAATRYRPPTASPAFLQNELRPFVASYALSRTNSRPFVAPSLSQTNCHSGSTSHRQRRCRPCKNELRVARPIFQNEPRPSRALPDGTPPPLLPAHNFTERTQPFHRFTWDAKTNSPPNGLRRPFTDPSPFQNEPSFS